MIAAPFGTFVGRAEIEAFWKNLIDGGSPTLNMSIQKLK